jgi:hypothetical protein
MLLVCVVPGMCVCQKHGCEGGDCDMLLCTPVAGGVLTAACDALCASRLPAFGIEQRNISRYPCLSCDVLSSINRVRCGLIWAGRCSAYVK